jgi:hypothetical protein
MWWPIFTIVLILVPLLIVAWVRMRRQRRG